jgi:hypothetical protein
LPHSRNPVCDPGRIFMVELLKQIIYVQSIYVLDGKASGRELSAFASPALRPATRFGT